MRIREYQPSDLAALRAIHAAQGIDYTLPDLSNPLFVTKLVLTDSAATGDAVGAGNCSASSPADAQGAPDDHVVGAALLRLTAETYLLLDPRGASPRDRWYRLLALHAAAERDAWQRGLEDVHAWLPPPIAAKFGKRLARLGWIRDDTWTPYCKRLMK